jgi:hypothetical protein
LKCGGYSTKEDKKMSTGLRENLKYIAGIILVAALGVLAWWAISNFMNGIVGVEQLSAFVYLMIAYFIAILVLGALKFRIRANLKYFVAVIVLTGFGSIAWYAEAHVAPQLGVFFGFIAAYLAAVIIFFYILGRYGG